MNKTTIIYLFGLTAITLSSTYLYFRHSTLIADLENSQAQCEKQFNTLEASLKNSRIFSAQDTNIKPPMPKKVIKAIKPRELVEAAREDVNPLLQTPKESLDDIVRRKYRFLLSKLQLNDEQLQELIRLLRQREQVYLRLKDAEEFADELGISLADIADLRYELDELDKQILDLTGDEDIANRFTLLKESDEEQHEFSQYTLGINGLFPLNQEQQEKVLFTRLEFKETFDTALQETGFAMDFPLSYAQQQEMLGRIDYALFKYKEKYLNGVKPHLEFDDNPMNQYNLLENYTNTEFEELRETYHEKVKSRGVIDPPPTSE